MPSSAKPNRMDCKVFLKVGWKGGGSGRAGCVGCIDSESGSLTGASGAEGLAPLISGGIGAGGVGCDVAPSEGAVSLTLGGGPLTSGASIAVARLLSAISFPFCNPHANVLPTYLAV